MLTGRRLTPGISSEQVDGYLATCHALGAEARASLTRVITDFLDVDSNARIGRYEDDIHLLGELFVNMTELRLQSPRIIIEPVDQRWAGQVAYSMVRLGDKARGFELIDRLIRSHTHKKGEKQEHDNLILINIEKDEKPNVIIPQKFLDDLEAELSNDPNDIEHTLLLAAAHSAAGNLDRSKELYERVLAMDSDNEEAILALINLSERHGLSKESLALGKKLVATGPPSVSKWVKYAKICVRHDLIEEGIRACEEARKYGDLSVEDLLEYGDLMFRSGRTNVAYKIYQEANRADPKNGYVWYNLGVCQQNQHLVQECIQSFQKAIEFDGPKGESYNRLAALFMQVGRMKDAVEHLEMASKLSPKNPKVWFNLAQCMRAVGLKEEAVRYFEIALSIDPGYELAQRFLAEILKEMDK
jgi:tetratricopeptide (TPR) repeat protein